ncbi:MAG TPA: ATP-binding protein, partial [Herpetosiphonaceae bacterium]
DPPPAANDGQQLATGPNADPNLLNARDLHADGEGRLWVAGNGLYLFDPAADALGPDLAGIPSQINAVTGGAGGLWLGSLDGLYGFDPATKTVTERQRRSPAFADSLAADAILCLQTDAEGVIWIGTVDGGVDLLDLRQTQFDFYRDDPLSANQFAGRQFGALIEDPGDPDLIWVASGPVMHRFNRRTGEIKRSGTAGGAGVGPPEASNVSTLLRDGQGMLWFDGIDGVYRLDPATGETERFRPADAASFTVWALAPDGAGGLWASAVGGGLYRFDPNTGQFAGVLGGRDPSGLGFNDIRALHLARDGALWLGTSDGVGRYDPASGAVTAYRRQPGGPENAPSGWTNDIHEAANGGIWAGTSDGLFGFDPASQRWSRRTENDGLPARAVVGIEEDSRGDLWLATASGLARLSPASGAVRSFKRADGLQGDEFSPYSHYRSPAGELWFGGVNGLTAFGPERIADSQFQPSVALTSLQLAGREVAPGPQSPLSAPIWQTSRLALRHDQDIVTFAFAALSYGAPEQLRYQYMLDGFEPGWNAVGSDRRFATYTNLPAGDYVFRVRGSNRDGVWSGREVALALTVLPPWWETWWFRALALALLLGGLAAGVRWRLYAVQQRNRQLEREVSARTGELVATNGLLREARDDADRARLAAEEANQAKSVFLANMSHELRSPLNAILGFAQVMGRSAQLDAEQREHVGIIRRSGEHLLALINQVLDLSKIEANRMALHERDLDLHQLLDDLEDMFALRAEEKKLQLLFERDPATPRYVRGDDLKLRQVLINLLNNALKFTAEGGVALRVAPLADGAAPGSSRLRFEIEDTGPGIAAEELGTLFEAFTQTASGRQAQEGTGLGLPISSRFVQLMGGEIQVRSEPGRGSVFSFEIDAARATAADLAARPARRQVTGLAPGQERPRILVADDKWNNRQLLIRLLAPLGFEVREAEDGLQAVELWEEWEPHLIWMDMRMPRLSGYDAATRIKSTTKGQAVVIVALTASTLEEERAMVLSAGCDEFLRKPFR